MQISSDTTPTRTRQACDPCRRKKSKCPGEKPSCSMCLRLKQKCSYGDRTDDGFRVHKDQSLATPDSSTSNERFRRLESRVEQIFDLLGQTSRSPSTRPSSSTDVQMTTPRKNKGSEMQQVNFDVLKWRSELDNDSLIHLTSIYTRFIDHQPLPLLDAMDLHSLIKNWPLHTLNSFLAVSSLFSRDIPYEHTHQDSASLLQRAKRETMMEISEGNSCEQVLQSLCLLILGDLSLGNFQAVSMGIGIAGKIIIRHIMGTTEHRRESFNSKDFSRCCWSIFILDQIYRSHPAIPSVLPATQYLPNRPPSASTPFSAQNSESDLQGTQLQRPHDQGIDSYCLTLFSIWSRTLDLVQSIKRDESQDLWSAKSAYHAVISDLYDFETGLAQVHRAQRALFQEKSKEELETCRNYWLAWLTMQFLFHAIQETINHPFFHVANRKQHVKFRPPTFLQNTIDQALSHAGWIVKLIDMIQGNSFEVYDPFLGHLVSITATTYLFLFNSKDTNLANQSRSNFEACCIFLENLATVWPPFVYAVEKLRHLQNGPDIQINNSIHSTRALAHESVLWDVFNYSALTSPSTYSDNSNDTVELGVTTQFLSPLEEVQSGRTSQRSHENSSKFGMTRRSLGMDPALNANTPYEIFNIFDTAEMADFSTLNIGRDLWADFGQL